MAAALDLAVRDASDTRLRLIVSGVSHAFLNAIRRTILSDVPKMGIEEVTIYDNSSPLFDEILAHRLGLVPVPTDLVSFNFRDQCVCKGEGCPNCSVIYTLSREGPCTVVSGDLTPADARFAIKDKKIPLVKLLEGQRVMMECVAILGRGREHAKFQVASGASFREYPEITVKQNPRDDAKAIAASCAPKVFEVEGDKLVVQHLESCTLCRACEEASEFGSVKVDPVPGKFVVEFETDGSLSARDAVRKSTELLIEKCKDFETQLAAL
ncbi:MAG: DNA-directed RNA polymerase subunit D [Methanobacteriota archaeon]